MRNIAIAVGAFTCGRWSAIILSVALHRLFGLMSMRHGGSAVLVTSLIASLPDAVGAAISGIAAALLVESRTPARWVLIPATCWMLLFVEDALVRTPTWIDAVTQTAIAVLPAIVCVGAGRMAIWHRSR